MSDFVLRIHPANANHVPAGAEIDAGLGALRQWLPAAERIRARTFDTVRFIDAGGNWDGVSCSACGEDAEAWWSDAMSVAHSGGFSSLRLSAPCCGATVSLDSLHYGWPVGFARFEYEIHNPGVAELGPGDLGRLEAMLGCRLRVVPARV